MTANVNRLVEKWDKSDDIAKEADHRSRSAHHRIDEIRGDITWLWRTVIAAMIVGAINLLWKVVGQ
ncbi:hemolysin XhlA family protein [Paenibacillus sp. HJGM_3]